MDVKDIHTSLGSSLGIWKRSLAEFKPSALVARSRTETFCIEMVSAVEDNIISRVVACLVLFDVVFGPLAASNNLLGPFVLGLFVLHHVLEVIEPFLNLLQGNNLPCMIIGLFL